MIFLSNSQNKSIMKHIRKTDKNYKHSINNFALIVLRKRPRAGTKTTPLSTVIFVVKTVLGYCYRMTLHISVILAVVFEILRPAPCLC